MEIDSTWAVLDRARDMDPAQWEPLFVEVGSQLDTDWGAVRTITDSILYPIDAQFATHLIAHLSSTHQVPDDIAQDWLAQTPVHDVEKFKWLITAIDRSVKAASAVADKDPRTGRTLKAYSGAAQHLMNALIEGADPSGYGQVWDALNTEISGPVRAVVDRAIREQWAPDRRDLVVDLAETVLHVIDAILPTFGDFLREDSVAGALYLPKADAETEFASNLATFQALLAQLRPLGQAQWDDLKRQADARSVAVLQTAIQNAHTGQQTLGFQLDQKTNHFEIVTVQKRSQGESWISVTRDTEGPRLQINRGTESAERFLKERVQEARLGARVTHSYI